jgi:hypothetical protein
MQQVLFSLLETVLQIYQNTLSLQTVAMSRQLRPLEEQPCRKLSPDVVECNTTLYIMISLGLYHGLYGISSKKDLHETLVHLEQKYTSKKEQFLFLFSTIIETLCQFSKIIEPFPFPV